MRKKVIHCFGSFADEETGISYLETADELGTEYHDTLASFKEYQGDVIHNEIVRLQEAQKELNQLKWSDITDYTED